MRAIARIMLTLAALMAALALSGCSKTASAAARQVGGAQAQGASPQGASPQGAAPQGGRRAITVQAFAAAEGILEVERNSAGQVTASVTSQVAAQVSGVVASMPRKVGDWVSKGDVVIQLDDAQLRIALANSQASLETAKVNLQAIQDNTAQNSTKLELQLRSAQAARDSAQKFYDSQKALFDLGGISASALDTAGSQLASAQASFETQRVALDQNQRGVATTPGQNIEALKIAVTTARNNLEQAELNLRNASIRAPFDGQIAALNVAPGMYVSLNTAAFTLVSKERQVNFGVSPQDAPLLQQGTRLSFDCAGRSFSLRARQSPSAPVNGVVPLSGEGPGLETLPFGAVGSLRYTVALARGVLVPLSSLDAQDSSTFLYTVEEGKAAVVKVSVIAESGNVAAVSGIGPGATVIASPPPGLVAGAAVQTVPAQGSMPGSKAAKGKGAPGGEGAAKP